VRSTTIIAHAAIGRIGRPAFPAPSDRRVRNFLANLGRIRPRDREAMHGDLPSLHAPLRVVGRGRGWGVYQLASLAASLLRHPPPPTPKSELRSSRPHRFAGGGEELMAMAARPALQNWQALRWHTEI
jgi:hypothetical protein